MGPKIYMSVENVCQGQCWSNVVWMIIMSYDRQTDLTMEQGYAFSQGSKGIWK